MEVDENNMPEEQEGEYVEIYSGWAIWWFSVLASPLFGGVLLVLNLKAAGYKKAMYMVLAFIILYMIMANVVINQFLLTHKVDFKVLSPNLGIFCGITIGLNIIAGLILSLYFFKKYFPDNDYYPKSILSPLFITVFVILLLRVIGLGL
jgi:hypothetical protein